MEENIIFTKNKVFAYENSDGDKGIIIAKSIDKAKKIFHKNIQNARLLTTTMTTVRTVRIGSH